MTNANREKLEFARDIRRIDTSDWKLKNDGGHNDFYDFPEWVKNIDTLAEYLQLSFAEGNILKSLTANLGNRHNGTDRNREINKCLHYAKVRAKSQERVK